MNERLYNLIPLIYREKDFEQGQPLRALAAVLEKGYSVLNEDIEKLYENWFIELCQEHIIPYIGAQVGIDDLTKDNLLKSERRYVANYLAYKRRTGLESTLNNALYDSTGFKYITRDAYKNMASTWTGTDPELQMLTYFVDDVAIPFSKSSRTADFKNSLDNLQQINSSNIASLQKPFLQTKNGNINVNAVNLYTWRLTSLPVMKAQLSPVDSDSQRACYHLNPFGFDLTLSNYCEQSNDIYQEHTELKAITRADYKHCFDLSDDNTVNIPVKFYLLDEQQQYQYLPYSKIYIADLRNWQNTDQSGALIAFDPDNGRVKVLELALCDKIFVSYSYYSNTVFGAGPYYYRNHSTTEKPIWVCANITFEDSVQSINEALIKWQDNSGTIIITDNLIYQEDIQLDLKGQHLKIIADNNVQPYYRGSITLTNSSNKTANVAIEGLNIKGAIGLGDNIHLTLSKTTLLNKQNTLLATCISNNHRQINIINSLVSAFTTLKNTIIYVKDSVLLSAKLQRQEGTLNLLSSTVLGDLHCKKAQIIKDSIINGILNIRDSNDADISHSYIAAMNGKNNNRSQQLIIGTEFPHKILHFTSSAIQNRSFCTLSKYTAKAILHGASNGEEMGVFNSYKLRLREKKLIERIDKFLPYGLDIQLVTMD